MPIFGFLRRWHMTWGATAQEAGGQVAGDELMPDADIVATRVVEIDAPPAAIWPWLVQMGPGRGGAYTYAWIERRLGIDIRNTDQIIPELQDLKVGDEIPMPGYAMRVERLDPGQVLVIRSSNHAWVWSFELRPVNGHTRLISRAASMIMLAVAWAGPVGCFGQDAGVGVGGGDDAGVAEHLLDDHQVGAGCQGDGGGAVAQVVEPDRRQIQLADGHAEPVGEVLGPDRATVGVGEQRLSLPPA